MRDPPPDPRPRHSDPHPRGLRPAAPPPPAPYRRSRTWPSATSWERHRLSPGHRLQLWRGRGQGGRGRPPRLGGGRRRAGHWRREGPAVPTATAGHPADAALPDCRLRAGARPREGKARWSLRPLNKTQLGRTRHADRTRITQLSAPGRRPRPRRPSERDAHTGRARACGPGSGGWSPCCLASLCGSDVPPPQQHTGKGPQPVVGRWAQ